MKRMWTTKDIKGFIERFAPKQHLYTLQFAFRNDNQGINEFITNEIVVNEEQYHKGLMVTSIQQFLQWIVAVNPQVVGYGVVNESATVYAMTLTEDGMDMDLQCYDSSYQWVTYKLSDCFDALTTYGRQIN